MNGGLHVCVIGRDVEKNLDYTGLSETVLKILVIIYDCVSVKTYVLSD